jgi:hypothetical protein
MATMGTWDYGVTAQRKDSNDVITAIKVHTFNPDTTVNAGQEWTKDQGVAAIDDKGARMCTMLWDSGSNKWLIQVAIRVVTSTYGKYLRTDADNTPRDNLGNLPSF